MEQSEGGDFPPKSQPPQEQSDVSSSPSAAAADIPVRKLVRQLDFTGLTTGGASTADHQPELPKPPAQLPIKPPNLMFMAMQQPPQAPAIRPLV